ncbi:MAG: sigma-54 dependent transcriptional regulator [Candidatus Sedimenticola sp. (ex Thyasira tokunagai)]
MSQDALIIEDDEMINMMICRYMKGVGLNAVGVKRFSEAKEYLRENEPRLVVTDVRLPDGDCLEHLAQLCENQPVIVLTAYGSVRNAVDAIKAGASEYLVKPISPDELVLVAQRALDNAKLRSDHLFFKRQLEVKEGADSFMIGDSAPLRHIKELINDVAPTDMTVLITGESGAGKELVARAIHQRSERSDSNYVAVDCCTLQENLFESELFGHEKGSFTGADKKKQGLIEGAEGGTLFLDEIGEISATVQAKLLRVLETGVFRRVGGTKDLTSNVRIVAATNRDLREMSEQGKFRSDLFYRLEAFNIHTPPLRDRRDDIPSLVEHFIRNHNFSRRINKSLTKQSMRELVAYNWPGNVRELKNLVERAIILSRDKPSIRPEHLAFSSRNNPDENQVILSFASDPTLDEVEQVYLQYLLEKYSGHRAQIAQCMGISERHIYRLIQKYGFDA